MQNIEKQDNKDHVDIVVLYSRLVTISLPGNFHSCIFPWDGTNNMVNECGTAFTRRQALQFMHLHPQHNMNKKDGIPFFFRRISAESRISQVWVSCF